MGVIFVALATPAPENETAGHQRVTVCSVFVKLIFGNKKVGRACLVLEENHSPWGLCVCVCVCKFFCILGRDKDFNIFPYRVVLRAQMLALMGSIFPTLL